MHPRIKAYLERKNLRVKHICCDTQALADEHGVRLGHTVVIRQPPTVSLDGMLEDEFIGTMIHYNPSLLRE